jgi:hypothetical protein
MDIPADGWVSGSVDVVVRGEENCDWSHPKSKRGDELRSFRAASRFTNRGCVCLPPAGQLRPLASPIIVRKFIRSVPCYLHLRNRVLLCISS